MAIEKAIWDFKPKISQEFTTRYKHPIRLGDELGLPKLSESLEREFVHSYTPVVRYPDNNSPNS